MPPMDWGAAYTSMATTEGRHFAATASARVASSLGEMTTGWPVLGSVTVVAGEEPVMASTAPHTPKASTQATRAPANAMRKVLPPELFWAACWAWTGSAS